MHEKLLEGACSLLLYVAAMYYTAVHRPACRLGLVRTVDGCVCMYIMAIQHEDV